MREGHIFNKQVQVLAYCADDIDLITRKEAGIMKEFGVSEYSVRNMNFVEKPKPPIKC